MEQRICPFYVVTGNTCGSANTAVAIWFAEAYRWVQGSTWLGILNPLSVEQTVRVTLIGKNVTRTLTVPPRFRIVEELGAWNVSGDFGVEVICASVCAASLAMWDAPMKTAHESIPIVGCEVR